MLNRTIARSQWQMINVPSGFTHASRRAQIPRIGRESALFPALASPFDRCRSGGCRLMGSLVLARRGTLVEHFIDEAEFLRFTRAEETVALDGLLDLLDRLAGIFRH